MELLARDIMTQEVVACFPETRIEDAVRALAEKGISGMPVIDANRRVVGIVSESDLLMADKLQPPLVKTALYGLFIMPQGVMERIAQSRGVLVEDVMTKKVITFGPDTPVEEIAETMREKRINRVPIVDEEGKLMGIVSRADIIRALAQSLAERKQNSE